MNNYTQALEGLSTLAKTYMRISTIKTALTVFLVAYTILKGARVFLKKVKIMQDTPYKVYPALLQLRKVKPNSTDTSVIIL